jgi:hypothetical protein
MLIDELFGEEDPLIAKSGVNLALILRLYLGVRPEAESASLPNGA